MLRQNGRILPSLTKVLVGSPAHSSAQPNTRRLSSRATDSVVEGFKSDEHEFSPNRPRDVVNSAVNFATQTTEERLCNAESSDRESMAEYGAAPISLSSVMQSNVPEPFNATGRSPTHLNMPGGAAMRDSKYVSDRQQAAHAAQTGALPDSLGHKR